MRSIEMEGNGIEIISCDRINYLQANTGVVFMK